MEFEERESYLAPRNQPDGRRTSVINVALFTIAAILIPIILAYGFATQDEMMVLALVLCLLGVIVGLARPFWGLVTFVALLYSRPEDIIIPLQGLHFTLLVALSALVGGIFQKLLDREPIIRTPVNGMIIGFGALAILSTIKGENTFTAMLDMSKLVILVMLTINLANTPQRYRTLVSTVLCFTTYLAGYATILYFSGMALKREGILQAKGTGTFADPNDLSAALVAGLALALTRAVQTRGIQRMGYIALSMLLTYSTYLTNSRGGMIALIGVLAVFIFLYARSKWIAVALALIVGLGLLKFGPSRISQLNTKEESANSRFVFWGNGLEQLKASAFTGVGYEQFPNVNGGMTAHNSFVLCFSELGVAGYYCWLGVLYYCYRRPRSRQEEQALAENGTRSSAALNARNDRIGAQLALFAYLLALFWISRTYMPTLYLLMSLPIAHKVAFSGGETKFLLSPREFYWDTINIGLLTIGSIGFIWVLVSIFR